MELLDTLTRNCKQVDFNSIITASSRYTHSLRVSKATSRLYKLTVNVFRYRRDKASEISSDKCFTDSKKEIYIQLIEKGSLEVNFTLKLRIKYNSRAYLSMNSIYFC